MLGVGFASLKRYTGSAALVASFLGMWAGDAAAQLTPEDLARVAWIEETAISPDGRWVAYIRSLAASPGQAARGRARDLFLIPATGGEPRLVVSAEHNPASPSWSPDAVRLAFLAEIKSRGPHRQVYAITLDGAEPRALTRAPTDVRAFAFSPDGRSLGYLAPEPLPDAVDERQRQGYDAVLYGERETHVRLWVTDLFGGTRCAITPPDRTVRDFSWSPDGRVFALQMTEGTDRTSDRNFRRLYTVTTRGGELTPLARTEGPLGTMAWSPDGKRLAFVGATSLHDPAAQSVFVVPADGGERVNLTAGCEGSAVWVGWLDGETLLFGAIEGTHTAINAVSPAGGAIRRVLGGREESFLFLGFDTNTGLSFDARARTFAAPMDTALHPQELYVGTTDGRQLRRLTSHNAFIERVRLARQETIEWKGADGLRIEGILVHPLEERAGVRYPLVVIPHGGPERASLDSFLINAPQAPSQVFAGHGYAVLRPNYRGSIGRGVAFSQSSHRDLGGKELEDILYGIDHLVVRGLVDADRVAIQGHSHGGYLAALAAGRHSDRFKAVMASAPITNWTSFMGSNRNPIHQSLAHWNVWWYERWGLLADRSPVAHVRKSWTPLHIDHGIRDEDVPVQQSEELYHALRFAGAEVRLVAYPREGHECVEEAHQIDVMKRYLEWLDQHLAATPRSSRSGDRPERRR